MGLKRAQRALAGLACLASTPLMAQSSVASPAELDASFAKQGIMTVQIGPACTSACSTPGDFFADGLALQPDGKLLVAGGNDNHQTAEPDSTIVRLNSNGTPDGTFGSGGVAQVPSLDASSLYPQPDGSLLVAGTNPADVYQTVGIQRYSAFGAPASLVQWFAIPPVSGGDWISASETHLDRKGRLLVLGSKRETIFTALDEPELMRFLPSGELDTSFGSRGVVSLPQLRAAREPPSAPTSFATSKNGSIYVAALSRSPLVGKPYPVIYRFTASGKLDRSFGRNGMAILPGNSSFKALTVAAAPNGGVLLAAGEDVQGPHKRDRLAIARYTKTGKLDSSFGWRGIAVRTLPSHDAIPPRVGVAPELVPSAIAFGAHGDLVVAGTRYTYTPATQSVSNWLLTRLTPDGFDCSFGAHGVVLGGAGTSATATVVEPGGRIVIAGESNHELAVARYLGGGRPRTCSGEGPPHRPH